MSSTGEDRSLASGIPIPQWMRSKTDKHGFDPSTLSPPTHEGDFFYIKFPRAQSEEPSKMKTLSEVIEVKEQALIKHTESCKQFIPKIQDTVPVEKPKVIKPMGVDDGFKGEGAACGASVVEVAHQMLAGKGKGLRPLNRGETEGSLAPPASYLQKRRDSKSLPASPMASPESSPLTKRKNDNALQNRLFKAGFFLNEESLNRSDEEIDKKSGSSWILQSLFSSKDKKQKEKESTKQTSALEIDTSNKLVKHKEETSDVLKDPVNMTVEIKAISSNPAPSKKESFLKSKSHLRDLNMFSPTSM